MIKSYRFLVSGIVTISVSAFATETAKIPQFTPGSYVLKTGAEEDCGGGAMGPREDTDSFGIGDWHAFELKTQSLEMPGDAPGDEDCTYKVQDTVTTQAEQSTLTFSEVRVCKGETQHTLTETARIFQDKIELDAVQSGEDPIQYSCVWELVKKKPAKPVVITKAAAVKAKAKK